MTLKGVGKVVGVPETVTQSPSVVNADVTEYAVMMRYNAFLLPTLFFRLNILRILQEQHKTDGSHEGIRKAQRNHLPIRPWTLYNCPR